MADPLSEVTAATREGRGWVNESPPADSAESLSRRPRGPQRSTRGHESALWLCQHFGSQADAALEDPAALGVAQRFSRQDHGHAGSPRGNAAKMSPAAEMTRGGRPWISGKVGGPTDGGFVYPCLSVCRALGITSRRPTGAAPESQAWRSMRTISTVRLPRSARSLLLRRGVASRDRNGDAEAQASSQRPTMTNAIPMLTALDGVVVIAEGRARKGARLRDLCSRRRVIDNLKYDRSPHATSPVRYFSTDFI
jgi:hypothetical protein